jgi:NAD(P)-dependent dehydrogenase (short-subunit alcohol dehydrogenase family)
MSTLKTLGEIVEYMQGLMGDDTPTPPAAAPVPTPAADAPDADRALPLGRYALEMVPSPALGLGQPALQGAGEVLVTQNGTQLPKALVAELQRRGVKAIAVDTVPPGARAVIFTGGLRKISDVDAAIAVEREAFAVARTLAPTLTEEGGLFVSIQDTGGAFGTTDFPAERAYLAGLPALVKTAAQEWPKASLKAIDIQVGSRKVKALATAIADELLLGGGDIEVGLTDEGLRLTPRSVKAPIQTGEAVIGSEDVVLVSGGARGVTAACIIEWAKDCKAKFLLVGRSTLDEEPACCVGLQTDAELKGALLAQAKKNGEKLTPNELSSRAYAVLAGREIRGTLAAIEKNGGQARYRSASVTDLPGIIGVLTETRKDWGPISGLVHGAGVLADRRIADQTDAQFDKVFNTKIEGLRVLLEATQADKLKLICMFSSVSARCGNNGQATYAMANEVLNKVAWAEARSRGGDVLVKSLGWGPWEGGMVNPQLKAHFAKLGVPMIPLAIGARMLADELHGAHPEQVEIVLGGEPRPEALLVVGSESRSLNLEVMLNKETHSYLEGHSINGEVVVPVVLVIEWFSRLAKAFRPDLHLATLKDLKVLKGIQIQDFDGGGDRLLLNCHHLSNGTGALLNLELRSPGGTLHYRAQAQMIEDPKPDSTEAAPRLSLNEWGGAPIYGDVLFHKDEFQVIKALNGVGNEGISGTLKGVDKAKWGWENWNTDVAALDGGLQLLLLWARDAMGGAALPMGIGEIRMSANTPPVGHIECTAQCRTASKSRGVADVSFHDEEGTLFTEFKNVELILRPDSK